jgi:hypothetical protein
MEIIANIRYQKGYAAATFYKDIRKSLKLEIKQIYVFCIDNQIFFKKISQDHSIIIPKVICGQKEFAKIKILGKANKVSEQKSEKNRSASYVELLEYFPHITSTGYPTYYWIQDNYLYFWYNKITMPLKIKNTLLKDKTGLLAGFLQGDGTTCSSIRSLRLTNCEPSILIECYDLLKRLGIVLAKTKLQIIYSSPKDVISEKKQKKIMRYWEKILPCQKCTFTISKNDSETLEYGSCRLTYNNSNLAELFVFGICLNSGKKF